MPVVRQEILSGHRLQGLSLLPKLVPKISAVITWGLGKASTKDRGHLSRALRLSQRGFCNSMNQAASRGRNIWSRGRDKDKDLLVFGHGENHNPCEVMKHD